MVSFTTDRVWISISQDGVDWNKPLAVTEKPEDYSVWPLNSNLIQFLSGKLIIAYTINNMKDGMWVTFSDEGLNWSKPKYIKGVVLSPLTTRSMVLLDSGELLIMNFNGVYKSIDGVEWEQISEYTGMDYLSLLQKKDGKLLAIGSKYNVNHNNPKSVIITSPDGSGWSTYSKLSEGFHKPSLIQMENGSFLCVGEGHFYIGDTEYSDTFFHSSKDGTNWKHILFTFFENIYDYSLIKKSDGNYMIAYLNPSSESNLIHTSTFSDSILKELNGPFIKTY